MTFKVKPASNGRQYYFTIVASNGEPLATSEMYNAKSSAVHAVRVIQRDAGGGTIEDLT